MQLDIRTCTAREIVGNPSFPALRREYADESAVAGLPDPQEKLELYQLMEHSGALQIYGAFLSSDADEGEGSGEGQSGGQNADEGQSEGQHAELVGFVAVLAPVLPHYGVTIAVTESLFVAAAHRKTGAGLRLIRRAEQHARDVGSPGLLVSAPSRGRLATLLPRLGYHETNRAFLKRMSHA